MKTNQQKVKHFMQLYQPVQQQLSAYCRVVAGSEDKALDLIQDTLAIAFGNLHTLREPNSFRFYLIAIARNCYLKQQRRSKLFAKQTEINSELEVAAPESVDKNYDIKLMHLSINKLNKEQREVILLFYIMDMPIKEIAENLKISEAAIKNRLARGREKLKKMFSDKESILSKNISAHQLKTTTK